jgi:methyl-accepting chemotaxis protein
MADSSMQVLSKAPPANVNLEGDAAGSKTRHGKPRRARAKSGKRAPAADHLERFVDLSAALLRASSVSELAATVLDSVRQAQGLDYASLWALDASTGSSRLLGGNGAPAALLDEVLPRRVTRGDGLHGRAWQEGRPVRLDDASPFSGCERAARLRAAGLLQGVCLSVQLDGSRLYVFEFLGRAPLQPSLDALEAQARFIALRAEQLQTAANAAELIREREQSLLDAERERAAHAALQQRISALLVVVDSASAGDLRVACEDDTDDVAGRTARTLGQFLAKLRQSVAELDVHANTLARSSAEVLAGSRQLSGTSKDTSNQGSAVSAAAEQVSGNLQTVAAGVEEMTASIKEIASNAIDAARVAVEGVRVAERTTGTVGKLGDSSAEIGKVIKVITSIAQQTNLLALNATIEAARAGEAGKGFAVVANEVKELAKETAKATEDISQKIEAIQEDTHRAVDAIARISEIIGQINDIQSTIAAAVEEQTATTNEISRNISEAARGSSEIARGVTHVASSAQSTTVIARDTEQAASKLASLASEFQNMASRFRY